MTPVVYILLLAASIMSIAACKTIPQGEEPPAVMAVREIDYTSQTQSNPVPGITQNDDKCTRLRNDAMRTIGLEQDRAQHLVSELIEKVTTAAYSIQDINVGDITEPALRRYIDDLIDTCFIDDSAPVITKSATTGVPTTTSIRKYLNRISGFRVPRKSRGRIWFDTINIEFTGFQPTGSVFVIDALIWQTYTSASGNYRDSTRKAFRLTVNPDPHKVLEPRISMISPIEVIALPPTRRRRPR